MFFMNLSVKIIARTSHKGLNIKKFGVLKSCWLNLSPPQMPKAGIWGDVALLP